MVQKVLSWNESIPVMSEIGEKPYKLMSMKQAKFPVPDFSTIVTDGSGNIRVDNAVKEHYDRLQKPLIGRSAHRMEGNGHSFSGVFESVKRITRLTDSPEDLRGYICPTDRREDFPEGTDVYALSDKWWDEKTYSLEKAYAEILEFANPENRTIPSLKLKEYLEANRIQGFNPNDMNLLLMEQRAVDVFGMFMTSDQTRPNETVVHFQDRRTDRGGWVVYDNTTQRVKDKVDGDLEAILTEFGKLAKSVESHFGKVQQVEIGHSDKGVEVFQSRDINLRDASSVPRFAHYKTFTTGLHADGVGYYHLPILVIDALDSIHSTHFREKEDTMREVVRPYKEQIKKFMEENPEFIAVVKDAEMFTGYYSDSKLNLLCGKKEQYKELNEITRKAKVVFRGKCQNAIRHDDWDSVETGGINVWMSEREALANMLIHNQIVGDMAKRKARYYVDFSEEGYVPSDVTLLNTRQPIQTGDYVHVLANKDGTFVWRD